ncbi:MAG: hypothetical protein J7L41_03725 [Synergistetes bacterium]|nr:hypothetical protein [Synergistota bacterium]
MRVSFWLVLVVAVFVMWVPVAYGLTVDELEQLNWDNNFLQKFSWGKIDWNDKLLYVLGRAPLSQYSTSSAQSKLLAKRAAIVDARRNALLVLYALKYGVPSNAVSITLSGKIVREHLLKGWVQDSYYYVRVAIPLKKIILYCVKIK